MVHHFPEVSFVDIELHAPSSSTQKFIICQKKNPKSLRWGGESGNSLILSHFSHTCRLTQASNVEIWVGCMPVRIRTRDLWLWNLNLWYHIKLHAPTSSPKSLSDGEGGKFDCGFLKSHTWNRSKQQLFATQKLGERWGGIPLLSVYKKKCVCESQTGSRIGWNVVSVRLMKIWHKPITAEYMFRRAREEKWIKKKK